MTYRAIEPHTVNDSEMEARLHEEKHIEFQVVEREREREAYTEVQTMKAQTPHSVRCRQTWSSRSAIEF